MNNNITIETIKQKYNNNDIKDIIRKIRKNMGECHPDVINGKEEEYNKLDEELNFLRKYEDELKQIDDNTSVIESKQINEMINISEKELIEKISQEVIININKSQQKVSEGNKLIKEKVEQFDLQNKEIKSQIKGKGKVTKNLTLMTTGIGFIWLLPEKLTKNVFSEQIISKYSSIVQVLWLVILLLSCITWIVYKIKELDCDKKIRRIESEVFQDYVFNEFRDKDFKSTFDKRDLVEYINNKYAPFISIFIRIISIKGLFKYKLDGEIIESLADVIIERALLNGAITNLSTTSFLRRYEFSNYSKSDDILSRDFLN